MTYRIYIYLYLKSSISMTWGGWTDDLSGIWNFQYAVHEIGGIHMVENKFITGGTIYLNTSFVSENEVYIPYLFLHYLS